MKPYIFYSFRRCPYAIRCRMVLEYSQLPFSLIEVSLKNKPYDLVKLSHKERVTVPVLYHAETAYLCEESWDIMHWALERNNGQFDRDNWWVGLDEEQRLQTEAIGNENDGPFKYYLDCYKYPERYKNEWNCHSSPSSSCEHFWRAAQQQCLLTLAKYERLLQKNSVYLLGSQASLADVLVYYKALILFE